MFFTSLRNRSRWASLVVAWLAASAAGQGGTARLDFDSDTSGTTSTRSFGAGKRVATGGVNNTGYYSLTDALNNQFATLVVGDVDLGAVVSGFEFSADLRIGGGSALPADGLSINFVRAEDPVVQTGFPPNDPTYVAEEGGKSGLSIGLDAWDSLGGDMVGISVHVDGVLIHQESFPRLNGEGSDITSLQTGPRVSSDDPDTAISRLTWQPIRIRLATDGRVSVTYKTREVIKDLQTPFLPTPGRWVLAARTGGGNQAHHVDNIAITTVVATEPVVTRIGMFPDRVDVTVRDSASSTLVPSSIRARVNGTAVLQEAVSTVGSATSYRLPVATLLGSGTEVNIDITHEGSSGNTVRFLRTLRMPVYTLLPEDYAVASATGDGFSIRVHQLNVPRGPGDANSVVNAENQLSGGYIDLITGKPFENMADLAGAEDGLFTDPNSINFGKDAPAPAGGFTSQSTPRKVDEKIPGIPGTADAAMDNFALEIAGFVQLERGYYRMGVNSDEGFRVSVAGGTPDQFGLVLGQFNGSRLATDSTFDFYASKPGFYPMRLSWWESGASASLEWFMVDPVTGRKILLNDRTESGHVKVFKNGEGRARIASLSPFPGFGDAAQDVQFEAVLVDGVTAFDRSSIALEIDGQQVTPTVDVSGAKTTVRWKPAESLPLGSRHTGRFTVVENSTPPVPRVVELSFTVRKTTPDDLPASSFWIEAEDFDFDGGRENPSASTMPYAGGAYDGLGAVRGVDYLNNDGNESDLYRTELGADRQNEVNLISSLGNRFGARRPGGFDVSSNYRVGYIEGFEWQNYTRTIPAGVYRVYAALSFDGSADGSIRGSLEKVVSGQGTATQTTELLGTFRAPGSGGWGANDLVLMRDSTGGEAVVKLGGRTTLRFNAQGGDVDWFVLSPVSGVARPRVTSMEPTAGSVVKRNATFSAKISDLTTAVVAGSIRLTLDGRDVTAGARVVDTLDGATVTYTPDQAFPQESTHTYVLSFADSGTSPVTQTASTTFSTSVVGPGLFVIEAEDFNYDGGRTRPEASLMPYRGSAYAGLGAVRGVDYENSDANDSDLYRKNELPNVNISLSDDFRDRGTFEVSPNYRIGWVSPGEWYNYTRTFPAGNYEVWAALSFEGRRPHQIQASLQLVDGPANGPIQKLVELGSFDAAGTGGWGVNTLVPMTDATGTRSIITLGGQQTLRMTTTSGDYDYMLLVPTAAQPRSVFTRVAIQQGNLLIEWRGSGTLQSAAEITGPWTDQTGATSPRTVPLDGARRFYRFKP